MTKRRDYENPITAVEALVVGVSVGIEIIAAFFGAAIVLASVVAAYVGFVIDNAGVLVGSAFAAGGVLWLWFRPRYDSFALLGAYDWMKKQCTNFFG